ncbi:MAG: hypothetical protein R3B09_32740 [Nannocystaceae bacterium]
MRWGVLFLVIACSAAESAPAPTSTAAPESAPAAAPLVWKDVFPAGRFGEVFADARGIWRCVDGTCEHRTWSDGASTQRALPCDASSRSSFAASQGGTHVAQICGESLAITSLADGEVVKRGSPFAETDGLIVDEAGVVTLVGGHEVVRVSAEGVLGPFTLTVPADAITPQDDAELLPARGRWLAYTHGAYAREVAWRTSTTAPAEVALHGGAFFNGDQMWVSLMSNGYVRMTEGGPVEVAGRFGGGLMGHGLLFDVVPWGADGLIAQYEDAALLLDRDLKTQRQISTPNAPETYGILACDPTGERLVFVHEDGRVVFAAL